MQRARLIAIAGALAVSGAAAARAETIHVDAPYFQGPAYEYTYRRGAAPAAAHAVPNRPPIVPKRPYTVMVPAFPSYMIAPNGHVPRDLYVPPGSAYRSKPHRVFPYAYGLQPPPVIDTTSIGQRCLVDPYGFARCSE